jgi:hypothetical protein
MVKLFTEEKKKDDYCISGKIKESVVASQGG